MKINEKNLVYFASSKTAVDKEGWLLKRGEVNKSFQKRWFMLKGNLLFYMEKRNDKEPIGIIILEGCTIELAENEDQYTFKIVFHGAAGRTYILGADTQESMESWMKALACASYDYMKLMVAELQRQMDELTAIQKVVESSAKLTENSPVAPPRHHRSRRVNPFDRCQSEDNVENLAATTSKGKPHSVPNTPVPLRPAPPPPPCNQGTSSSNQSLHQPKVTQAELQTSSDSLSSCANPTKKTFADLHDEYGQKIKKYLQLHSSLNYTDNPNNLIEIN